MHGNRLAPGECKAMISFSEESMLDDPVKNGIDKNAEGLGKLLQVFRLNDNAKLENDGGGPLKIFTTMYTNLSS